MIAKRQQPDHHRKISRTDTYQIKEFAFLKVERLPHINIHICKWTRPTLSIMYLPCKRGTEQSLASSIPNPKQTPMIPATLHYQICKNGYRDRWRCKNTLPLAHDHTSSSDRQPTPCKTKAMLRRWSFHFQIFISSLKLSPFPQTPSNVNRKKRRMVLWYANAAASSREAVCSFVIPMNAGKKKPD